MGYFPFMIELADARGLIVGGGNVAYDKAVRIGEFGAKLRVVAPTVDDRFWKLENVEIARRSFVNDDIDDELAFVIVATNDEVLNREIANRCRERRILVNVVDSKEDSSFFFPATTRQGDLTVSVSTGGASPIVASVLARTIGALIPRQMGAVVKALGELRAQIIGEVKDIGARRRLYRSVIQDAITKRDAIDQNSLKRQLASRIKKPNGSGRVFLVGAGAGPADLITLRGASVLATCDAVLYDDLIDEDILNYAPSDALRLSVGKRGGRFSTRQDDINFLMIELASRGLNVVRLKGGDPFIFARVEEEISALKKNGVLFDVVPGVSSAFFIPMEAGVPLTCRNVSRSVHIVTAHASHSDVFGEASEFAQINGTLVVMMGLSVLPQLADYLIAHGKDPKTPVAVLSGGNSPNRYDVRGTLDDIVEKCKQFGAKPPAVIVIGQVASLNLKSDLSDKDDSLRTVTAQKNESVFPA